MTDKKQKKKKKHQSRKPKVYPIPPNFFGDSETQWAGRKIEKEGGLNGKKVA